MQTGSRWELDVGGLADEHLNSLAINRVSCRVPDFDVVVAGAKVEFFKLRRVTCIPAVDINRRAFHVGRNFDLARVHKDWSINIRPGLITRTAVLRLDRAMPLCARDNSQRRFPSRLRN